MEAYWDAYHELDSDRQLGFGAPGPVPWSSIDRYAVRYGFDGDEFDDLVYAMRAMDVVYLKHVEATNK